MSRFPAMVYSGKMRLASALAFTDGMQTLEASTGDFATRTSSCVSHWPLWLGISRVHTKPAAIRIVHGDRDRNTSHVASSRFIDRCSSRDKSYRSFRGEHAMVRVSLTQQPTADSR